MTSAFPDAHEELQRALDRNELLLAYQPIVDLNDGSLGGVEALIRWNHPTRGLLWPGDFLPAIEGSEMSTRLGSYVIDEAAGQAAAWRSQTPGRALPVAINVSGSHFESDDLVVQLAHALRTNDLEPGALALEVGERSLFRDVTRNRARIESLKHLGAQIVVDDFGTAYATAMDGDAEEQEPGTWNGGSNRRLAAVARHPRRVLRRRDRDRPAPAGTAVHRRG